MGNLIEYLKRIFKKKEIPLYHDYGVITYNNIALRNGISDMPNKIIIRYKYNPRTETMKEYKVYGYSDSLVYNLRHILKVPLLDQTSKKVIFPVYSELNLDEVSYKKG